jgi:hypothetical protein
MCSWLKFSSFFTKLGGRAIDLVPLTGIPGHQQLKEPRDFTFLIRALSKLAHEKTL